MSATVLWVSVQGVRLDDVARHMSDVQWLWLVPMVLSVLVRFWLTALRWQLLLRPVKRVSVNRLFGTTMIGFMAGRILPARLGELVRAAALARVEALPVPLTFATLVIERVFDGFTLLLFLAAGPFLVGRTRWVIWSAALAGLLYAGVLGTLLTLRTAAGLALLGRVLDRLPRRLGTLARRLLESFRPGLAALGDARAVLAVSLYSLVIWTVNAVGMQATLLAFSLDLPFQAAFFVLATIGVALVLPAAPSHIGTLQLGTVVGLAAFGVAPDLGFSVSIIFHVANTVPIVATGLVYMTILDLRFGELRAASERGA